MGKLIGSTIFPNQGGSQVKVKYRGKLAAGVSGQGVRDALRDARLWLLNAELRLGQEPLTWSTHAALEHWMDMDKNGPSPRELEQMLKIIGMTRKGLAGHMTIRVHQMRDLDGFVRWSKGTRLAGELGWFDPSKAILGDDGRPVRHGDIHLDSDIFNNPEYAAFVLLHEAMHKHANTQDYGKKGYTAYLDSLGYKKSGLTKSQALKNADSYAQLCHDLWRNP